MKKIVLPTVDGHIDDHFGHCAFYTLVTVDDAGQIIAREELPSPQGCGCKSGIASELAARGVTLMLAGNMGTGALNKLTSNGIEVIRGCSGTVEDVLSAYLSGNLKDSGVGCHQHDDPSTHQCSH